MASISTDNTPLSTLLENVLPKGLNLSVYHTQTPPEDTEPLYLTPKGAKPAPTTLESHFLGLSLLPEGVFIYGIEILIYVTTIPSPAGTPLTESTFFVSKADSSGYLPRRFSSFTPSTSPTKLSTLKEITRTFLSYLISTHLATNPSVSKYTISLFARAQNQYLFPDSVSVPTKHILDDRGLIRWWCSVLDPLYQSCEHARAYLLVPGLEAIEVRGLLPPHSKYPAQYPEVKNKWTHGCPFVIDEKTSVREVIPHFPDDPKARFMDELEYEGVPDGAWEDDERIGQGWKKLRTVEMFWEIMSMRQECSLGRMVGFAWVVVEREVQDTTEATTENTETTTTEKTELENKETTHPEPTPTDLTPAPEPKTSEPPTATTEPPTATTEPSTTEPSTTEPSTTEPSTTAPPTSPSPPPENPPLPSPTPTAGESLIPPSAFTSLYELLTDDKRTDFMNLPLATKSTKNWIKKVFSFSQDPAVAVKTEPLHPVEGVEAQDGNGEGENVKDGEKKEEEEEDKFWDWGQPISGKLEVSESTTQQQGEANTPNVLSVRKKRNASIDVTVNTLGAGLVRKKVKTDEPEKPVEEKKEEVGINILGAGLVRRKPVEEKKEESRGDGGVKVNVLGAGLVRRKPKEENKEEEKKE